MKSGSPPLQSAAGLPMNDDRISAAVGAGAEIGPASGVDPGVFRRQIDDAQVAPGPDNVHKVPLVGAAPVRAVRDCA